MPKLLDINAFCENLPEIKTTKVILRKKFHPDGLFSEQIFGPLKNYTCQCGQYFGINASGGKCSICNVDIVHNSERRKRFAKITLPIPVVNPLFLSLLKEFKRPDLIKNINSLMRDEKSVMYINDDDEIIYNISGQEKNLRRLEKVEAIKKIVEIEARNRLQEGKIEWKTVLRNVDSLIIKYIIVLPPDLRPPFKNIMSEKPVVDPINRYYMQVLVKRDAMNSTVINIAQNKNVYYDYFRQLQRVVNDLFVNILDKIGKKSGLIRGNIIGRRIDFSGRAVIAVDPTLNIDECSIPYFMVLEIYKIKVAKRLRELGYFKMINTAVNYIDECIENNMYSLYNIANDVVKDEVCILNRQPSLHRLSMLGFNLKMSKENVIKIHPLVCDPYNADFDGDQMAVYIPLSDIAKDEIRNKMMMTKNLISPTSSELTTVPSEDIIFGIYKLTSDTTELSNKTLSKGEYISEGRAIFNECLPPDYPLIDYTITSTNLLSILKDIHDRYGKKIISEVLDKIKLTGFKYLTIIGSTISLDDCIMDGTEEMRDSIYNSEDPLGELLSDKTLDYLKSGFKYVDIINSGARSNWDQARQLVLSRGYVSNFKGEILDPPIYHSLVDGLTEREFFNSTYGCRKGLLDVALNTGASGYLSRKLLFTCANLQIDVNIDDCGTKDCLHLYINCEKKAKSLIGRYYHDNGQLNLITLDNYHEIVDKTINLRSPIFCRSPKLCRTCYGELYKVANSRFVGIIAAQALGERGTQLTLRTFHLSGSASVGKNRSDEDKMKQVDIISDLHSVSKALYKFKGKTYKDILESLFNIYTKGYDMHHVHFECVVTQLMWVGGTKWRLLEDRDRYEPSYYTIQTVPSLESWLLGLSFSNPKKNILKGILREDSYNGVFDYILLGNKID